MPDMLNGAGNPAPFAAGEGDVLPGWIDGNGHLNLAYYLVLFDQGTDALFEALGFGAEYRRTAGGGPFAVESHILYQHELLAGDRVRISTQIVGADDKRLHLAHEMHRISDGTRAAAQEVLYLHVDLASRRVTPFRPDLRERIAALASAHAAVGRPEWIGRHVAMPDQRTSTALSSAATTPTTTTPAT